MDDLRRDILAKLGRSGEALDDAWKKFSDHPSEYSYEEIFKYIPNIAAKIYRAMGMRIVNAKKSKYYDAALSNFEQAKRYYEKAGLDSMWQATVAVVRKRHHRKYSFMPGFEEIVAGKGPSTQPSFLERAKKRWKKYND